VQHLRRRKSTFLGIIRHTAALSHELAWTKYLDFTTASDVYITTVDKAFKVITSTSLRGANASLNLPAEDPEAFRSSLRDTAKWVLADLRSEMGDDDK
jgi:hypothetical protein